MNLADMITADLSAVTDLDSAISIGQTAADDEERGRWRLAALVNAVDRMWGKAVIPDFAKGVNRKKSYIYEAGQTYAFYGPAHIFELTENRVITFSHMRDAMRAYRKQFPGDVDTARDEALHWLDVVAGDLMTVEQAALKLKERLGILPQPVVRFTGTVRSVGERHVMLVLDENSTQRMDALFTEGERITVSARAEKGEQR